MAPARRQCSSLVWRLGAAQAFKGGEVHAKLFMSAGHSTRLDFGRLEGSSLIRQMPIRTGIQGRGGALPDLHRRGRAGGWTSAGCPTWSTLRCQTAPRTTYTASAALVRCAMRTLPDQDLCSSRGPFPFGQRVSALLERLQPVKMQRLCWESCQASGTLICRSVCIIVLWVMNTRQQP